MVSYGVSLVLSNRKTGPTQYARFAHPILRCRPYQVPDLVGIATNGSDIDFLVSAPTPVQVQFREAT